MTLLYDADQLYDLLPALYRTHDQATGGRLRALIEVLADQSLALEENLAQLYDDQFIETSADWVVPYIGDLIGARGVYAITDQLASQRAAVANTIAYRRRKGTAAVLEQLARDVTGWSAHVTEFFQLLATTQYMNHTRPQNLAAPDLRRWSPLEYLNTPFTSTARTADVRRINSAHHDSRGFYNIPNIGVFLWRIEAFPISNAAARKLNKDPADRRYFFDALGRDLQLFNDPLTEDEITQLAQPVNVPVPISLRVLGESLRHASTRRDYYSESGRSLRIFVGGDWLKADAVCACDLSDDAAGAWAHDVPAGMQAAIDPRLGRFVLATAQATLPRVSYHYGFSARIGGGEYSRAAMFSTTIADVSGVTAAPGALQTALNGITADRVVEIRDGDRYDGALTITLPAGTHLELRAADEKRPVIVLGGDLLVHGAAGSSLTLNGLLIAEGALRVDGDIQALTLRHCTLVPASSPSLFIGTDTLTVTLDHSITGALRARGGAIVRANDSIIDALSASAIAYAALNGTDSGGRLSLESVTVIGKVRASVLDMVSNTIVVAERAMAESIPAVRADRVQEGCVRFSFLTPDAHTPRRYECQPESEAVRPQFTSLHHGDAGYMQLSRRTPPEILRGAEDESEMGAFHSLMQAQRETNLLVRLEEYLRFGLEAGIFTSASKRRSTAPEEQP